MKTPHTTEDSPEHGATPAASGAPDIKPLPTLSPIELAQAEIATLKKTLGELTGAHAALQREHASAREKLAATEENPFLVALFNMDAGAILEQIGEDLSDVTGAVEKLGNKGKLTLSILVKQLGSDGSLVLTPEVKTVVPKPELPRTVLYRTEEGGLSRNNPRQKEFSRVPGDRERFGDRAAAGESAK